MQVVEFTAVSDEDTRAIHLIGVLRLRPRLVRSIYRFGDRIVGSDVFGTDEELSLVDRVSGGETPQAHSADGVIAEAAHHAGATLVTEDRRLLHRAELEGISTMTYEGLLAWLDGAG